MSNFEIVLINPNNIQILNPYSSEFDNELKKISKVVNVTDNTLMEIVGEHLEMNKEENNFMGDTELCYETSDKKIYELCHIDIIENKIESRGENVLASQLCCIHRKMDGPVVLFGYKISLKTGIPINISVGYNELKEILINKYMHKGVYIHNSGNMIEFTYHNDLNILNQENQQNSDLVPRLKDIAGLIKTGLFYELSLYKYNLILIVPLVQDMNIDSLPTNKIITLFLNKTICKGDFIILSKVAKNDYTNFSIKELKKMVYLYDQKNLKSKDTKNEKVGDIKVVKNKYMILYNKFKEYRNTRKVSELMNNDMFHKFINETYEKFENNLECKDTILNTQIYNELNSNNKEKKDKQDFVDNFLKDKGYAISEEINIDVADES